MAVNRTPTCCNICGFPIPTFGGMEVNGLFVHLSCSDNQKPMVTGQINAVTGIWHIENINGRCEDRPSCGCCGEVDMKKY